MIVKRNSKLSDVYGQCETCLYDLVCIVTTNGTTDEYTEKSFLSCFESAEEFMGIMKSIVFRYRETEDLDYSALDLVMEKIKILESEIKALKRVYFA